MKYKRRHKIRRLRPVPTNCRFCKNNEDPNYKKSEVLEKFLSERGRILGKSKTGICSKHQRRLTREIKRARYLAFLPFVIKPL